MEGGGARGGGGGGEGGGGGRGKSAWKVWMASKDVIEAFCDYYHINHLFINESINLLERFIVLLCDQTSNEHSVNKAR